MIKALISKNIFTAIQMFLPKILRSVCVLLLVLCSYFETKSQSVYAPLTKEYSHLVDRHEIMSGTNSNILHTSFKPYAREDVYELASSSQNDTNLILSKRDKFNLQYLQEDNWEWSDSSETTGNSKKPIFKYLYRKKNAAFHMQSPYFEVQANPVGYLLGGKEKDGSSMNYINTRGAEIRGMIDKKVGFYSVLTTTQALYPIYVQDRMAAIRAVPGEGYFKPFQTNGVDYFTARGYLTFKFTKHIRFQFGHDRNFIGNGHRSLILSDYSSPYLFGKIQTKIWKINYTNLYAQLFYNTNIGKDTTYNRKFLTLHHFSINLGKHVNIGLFESIVYNRQNNQFDLNYLNPIIFYRYVETYMGSSDKATLGMDFKINFAKHVSIYGQLVLNEFRIKEVRNSNGWWGNKQAYQLGFKYINAFGAKNFDLQGEVNIVRPYTYSSVDGKNSYSHYNQSLAHPLGANFMEMLGIMRLQAHKRVNIVGKLILTKIGFDDAKNNYGSNILIPYEKIPSQRPYGNYISQGVTTTIGYAELNVSYMVMHNLFVDLNQLIREQIADNRDLTFRKSTFFSSLGIRYNFAQRQHEF